MTLLGTSDDGLAATAGGDLFPGWRVHYHATTSSTQDLARNAAARGAPTRSIFVADHQAVGRGRQGRVWLAPPGSSLLLSILFREEPRPRPPARSTILVSLALAEAVEMVVPELRPAIKWPNDLMLDGRKVAGVLAEAVWDGGRLSVVVGAGLNVRLDPEQLAPFAGTATSLSIASGRSVDRGELLRAFLQRLDERLALPHEPTHEAWSARLWGRNQRLRFRGLNGTDEERTVLVLGADPDGALQIQTEDGAQVTVVTGELIL